MKKVLSFIHKYNPIFLTIRSLKDFSNSRNLPIAIVMLLIVLILSYFYVKNTKEGFQCKPNELDQYIKSEEPTLVLFYADWCGHCTKLKPHWHEATKKANAETTRMIQIDVGGKDPEQKALMEKYEVDGFPTILVFQNGTATPYQGSRTTDAFLKSLGA
jgi:thiol:disulfide interchange protein